MSCRSYFHFVVITDDDGGRRVDTLDCQLDPGHDGSHSAHVEEPAPGTVNWE